jgi:hypothetical protein
MAPTGIHRCEPLANIDVQMSRKRGNAARTIGFAAVLQPLFVRTSAPCQCAPNRLTFSV